MKYLVIFCLLAALISAEIAEIESRRCTPPVNCTAPKIPDSLGCRCNCATNNCTGSYQIQNRDTCQCACRDGRTYDVNTSACECITKTCNANQTWDAASCLCKCNVAPTTCPTGQIWNYKACGCTIRCPERQAPDSTGTICVCANSPPAAGCPTGRTWSNTTCRCDCTASNTTCNTGFRWSDDSCSCKIQCSEPKRPDSTGTQCVCPKAPPAITCPTNRVWNATTCRCDCSGASTICPSNFIWSAEKCACSCNLRCSKSQNLDRTNCICKA